MENAPLSTPPTPLQKAPNERAREISRGKTTLNVIKANKLPDTEL